MRRIVLVLLAIVAVLSLFSIATFAQSAMPPGVPSSWLPVWPVILFVVQWVVGFVLKKNEKVNNAFIGWATFILSIVGYSIVPTEAHAFARGLLGVFAPLPNVMLMALQTAVTTGVHSWLLSSVVKPLLGKTTAATNYL